MEDLNVQTSSLKLAETFRPMLDWETSPIDALPPEIVAEIFLDFLPSYPEFPPHSGILSPLVLCRVCRRWRDIALSTPSLWRAISIAIDEPEPHRTEKLELLKTWIERSGNYPLALSFTGPPTSISTVLPRFLQTAVAQCERWEHLNVLIPFEHLHLLQGDMPLLRTTTFGPIDLRHDVESTLTLFTRAPQLRHVVLTACFLTATVHLPWAQLTHIDAHCLYEHECIDIFRNASALVACKLNVCCSDDDIRVGSTLPLNANMQLRDVVLLVDDPNVRLWLILDCLTLPALRTLQVPDPCVTLESLAALVARSACELEELRVTNATLAESAYRDALPLVGMIELDRINTLE
jgi:hypothetical protein